MALKALSISELAIRYFPKASVRVATTQLKRWINYNAKLRAELDETGYRDGQRMLTPKQIGLITWHLGEP